MRWRTQWQRWPIARRLTRIYRHRCAGVRSGPDFDCRASTCREWEGNIRDVVCGACVSAVPDEECDAEHISRAIF